jgi:hypothetical protein
MVMKRFINSELNKVSNNVTQDNIKVFVDKMYQEALKKKISHEDDKKIVALIKEYWNKFGYLDSSDKEMLKPYLKEIAFEVLYLLRGDKVESTLLSKIFDELKITEKLRRNKNGVSNQFRSVIIEPTAAPVSNLNMGDEDGIGTIEDEDDECEDPQTPKFRRKKANVNAEDILAKLKNLGSSENYVNIINSLASKLGSGWKYNQRNKDFSDEPTIMNEFKHNIFFCIVPSTGEKALNFLIYDEDNESFNILGDCDLDLTNSNNLDINYLAKYSLDMFNKAKKVSLGDNNG